MLFRSSFKISKFSFILEDEIVSPELKTFMSDSEVILSVLADNTPKFSKSMRMRDSVLCIFNLQKLLVDDFSLNANSMKRFFQENVLSPFATFMLIFAQKCNYLSFLYIPLQILL